MSMVQISDEEFDKLLTTFDHELVHLETRDAYGTAVELPHMASGPRVSPMTSNGCRDGVRYCARR